MAAISFRVPDATKTAAFEVFKNYGLSPSQAFNLFLAQVAKTQTIPVSLDYQAKPNTKTLAAIEELEQGEAETIQLQDGESLGEALFRIAQE